MLQKLLHETAFNFSLLIKDSSEQPGLCLAKSLITNLAGNGRKVLSVLMEPMFGRDSLFDQTHKINVFGDEREVTAKITEAANCTDCCVVFPSLSLYLLNNKVSELARIIRSLQMSDNVSTVVAVIHKDVLQNEDTLGMCEYLFSAVIDLLPVEGELSATYHGHVKCLSRKSNGKLETSDEFFSLSNDGALDMVHASTSAAIQALVDEPSADITNKLTFNLKLSDKEREAKNNLQLPYLKKDSEKSALLSQTLG